MLGQGLVPLQWHDGIARIARQHAEQMASGAMPFSHPSASRLGCGTIARVTYPRACGYNTSTRMSLKDGRTAGTSCPLRGRATDAAEPILCSMMIYKRFFSREIPSSA